MINKEKGKTVVKTDKVQRKTIRPKYMIANKKIGRLSEKSFYVIEEESDK